MNKKMKNTFNNFLVVSDKTQNLIQEIGILK
jgi:hypothetical protein